jgi:integrase/recombinase XerD
MGLYLPYANWPEADRTVWAAAFVSGSDPFDDCPAAHLADRTRQQLQYAYAKFLFFIASEHEALLNLAPARRVSRKIIEGYVKSQPATCGPVTLANYLNHLWLALRYICPDEDWSWLPTIGKRVRALAKSKPTRHHLVTSETLYALGIELMDLAMMNGITGVSRRIQTAYRDGLIIALLALVPLRRRTLAALQIGNQLVRSGKAWTLDIPPQDIKTGRALEFSLEGELSERIEFYLNKIRPLIPGSGAHQYLWAVRNGPMSDRMIYKAVRRRTLRALGFPVNLHRFRHAAATLWSMRDPANVRGVKDLLGHATFAPTENHYIMAQSRLAGRALAKAIEKIMQGEGRAS